MVIAKQLFTLRATILIMGRSGQRIKTAVSNATKLKPIDVLTIRELLAQKNETSRHCRSVRRF